MWTADHTCGAVDESGEQPEEQPNRLETVTGSERPRVLPKQRERKGKEMGARENQKRREQHLACFLPPRTNHSSGSSISSGSSGQRCVCSDAHGHFCDDGQRGSVRRSPS